MIIAEKCDRCGAERPDWLSLPHTCPADYVRIARAGFGFTNEPEPHTAEEYFADYLRSGNKFHNYPSFLPART